MIDPSMSRPIIHQRSPHSFVNTVGSPASFFAGAVPARWID
jgi:hypothetical protein